MALTLRLIHGSIKLVGEESLIRWSAKGQRQRKTRLTLSSTILPPILARLRRLNNRTRRIKSPAWQSHFGARTAQPAASSDSYAAEAAFELAWRVQARVLFGGFAGGAFRSSELVLLQVEDRQLTVDNGSKARDLPGTLAAFAPGGSGSFLHNCGLADRIELR